MPDIFKSPNSYILNQDFLSAALTIEFFRPRPSEILKNFASGGKKERNLALGVPYFKKFSKGFDIRGIARD